MYINLQTCKDTKDIGALQKAADFVKAFTLGFEVDVSITGNTFHLNSGAGHSSEVERSLMV